MTDPCPIPESATLNRSRQKQLWLILALTGLSVSGGIGLFVFADFGGIEVPEVKVSGVHVDVSQLIDRMRRQVLESPSSADAWGTYGMCLLQHERPREALICFEQASHLDATNVKWKYFAGFIEEQTDFAKATAWYAEAAAIGAGDLFSRLRLAGAMAQQARTTDALEQLTGLQKDFPAIPEVYVQLLRVGRLNGDVTEAQPILEMAHQNGAESKALFEEAAVTEMQQGDAVTARKYLSDAQQRPLDRPTTDPWMEELRRFDVSGAMASLQADGLMAQGQLAQAAGAMASLARRFPDRSRPALNHALMLLAQGLADAAVRELSELTRRFPDDPLIRFQYAVALAQTRNPVAAESELRECLRLKPDFGIARAALGDLLELSGRTEESIECYRKATADAVDDAGVRLGFAALLIRQKRWAEAESVLADAERLANGSEAIIADLAILKQTLATKRID